MKTSVFLFLIMLMVISCKEEKSQIGTCEIQYSNISSLPSSSISVRVTDQNSLSLEYNLTPEYNKIILPLESGDQYIIRTGEIRIDSVYNVRFLWSDNNVIDYSFMFDNVQCNKISNIIVLVL